MSRCYGPFSGVVPPHSAAISMSAPAVGIAPSPSIAAETDTARSVRPRLGNAGSLRVGENYSPRATCMWSSHCQVGWHLWCCRTRRSFTISCSAPVRRLFSKLVVIRGTSVQRSVSSAYCTPGASSSTFIRMSIVSCPPAASHPISPAGRSEEHTSELQSQSNLVCRLLLEKKKHQYQDIEGMCDLVVVGVLVAAFDLPSFSLQTGWQGS